MIAEVLYLTLRFFLTLILVWIIAGAVGTYILIRWFQK